MTAADSAAVEEVPAAPAAPSKMATLAKTAASCALLYSAFTTLNNPDVARRQLSMVGDAMPLYMDPLMKDLRERKKLFDETPPEEVKYWFEYSGPLQVSIPTDIVCIDFILNYVTKLSLVLCS